MLLKAAQVPAQSHVLRRPRQARSIAATATVSFRSAVIGLPPARPADRRTSGLADARTDTAARWPEGRVAAQMSQSVPTASVTCGCPPCGSHTLTPNTGLTAHGCYRLVGPARISKRGDQLVARLFPGSRVELLDRDGRATPVASPASSISHASMDFLATEDEVSVAGLGECGECNVGDASGDDGCVGECVLVGAHVELGGSANSVDLVDLAPAVQPAVHHHNGHTYVSVRSLPEGTLLELDADAALSHPINITPIH